MLLTLSHDSVTMGGMDGGWTVDELVRRVAQALAADDVRAPNGRVREVPDARAIRWYATIGLVDRPGVGAGRSACYGPRQLRQVVAVKRLQAGGHTLAEIQQELTGATDATLDRVARIPAGLLAGQEPTGPAPARPAARSAKFWADRPAEPPAPAEPAAADPPAARQAPPQISYLIPLGGGTALALPSSPTDDDLTAIHAAAAPLLKLLAGRGLTDNQTGGRDEHRPH
jgi:DNA-binding transcriptional MerR regulator